MVMLEAMACGTPVLAFPEGAAPEVVDDGVTGFLCEDDDAMVRALGRLGRAPSVRTAGLRWRAISPPSAWWPSTSSSTRS
jgi:glycosyltransferase involved in cell wall biosynthesis